MKCRFSSSRWHPTTVELRLRDFLRVLAFAAVVIGMVSGAANSAVSFGEEIEIGDSSDIVIAKLKSKPDYTNSYRTLGASYQLMTFTSRSAVIKVRFLFGHAVSIEITSDHSSILDLIK